MSSVIDTSDWTNTARARTSATPVPTGTMIIAYIARHPLDEFGLGAAVLMHTATGIESYWDGIASRSLPPDWRRLVGPDGWIAV